MKPTAQTFEELNRDLASRMAASYLIQHNGTKNYVRWVDPSGCVFFTSDSLIAREFKSHLACSLFMYETNLSGCSVVRYWPGGRGNANVPFTKSA